MQVYNIDLGSATAKIVEDLYGHVQDFDSNAASLRRRIATKDKHEDETARQVDRLIDAYQALVTCVLGFSIQSPRYGISGCRLEDGSFVIAL